MSIDRKWTSKKKRALEVLLRLKRLYPDATCSLDYTTPVQLLVATILSAQCTDERVNKVTPALFAKFPDARSMAYADILDIEELVRSTGFYHNKAKNIQGACRKIVEEFDGEVPQLMEQLLTLPGVARKTANVVSAHAFGNIQGVTVDTHVMDLSMPGQSGIDALAMIRAKAPDVGILILSGYPEEHYAVNLIRQGASGYLNKECDPSEIVDAIRVISLGKRYITPTVAELLAQQLNRPNDMASHEQLSEREFQVFLKLAKGETAGDIAKALSLSVKTVSTYRTRVMEKMSLASNSDLTYYALKNKLID